MNDIVNLKRRLQRQLGEFRIELETMKVKIKQRFKTSSGGSGETEQASSEAIAKLDEKLVEATKVLASVSNERQWISKRNDVLRLWEELRDDFFAARSGLFPAK